MAIRKTKCSGEAFITRGEKKEKPAALGGVCSGDRQYRGLYCTQWRWASRAAGRTDGHIAGGRSTLRQNLQHVHCSRGKRTPDEHVRPVCIVGCWLPALLPWYPGYCLADAVLSTNVKDARTP